jgi:hypothetical protein
MQSSAEFEHFFFGPARDPPGHIAMALAGSSLQKNTTAYNY